MSTTVGTNGRLCNQIFRNLATSFIAKKNNLYVDYYNYEKIKKLGINLFIGDNKYQNTIELNDDNYFEILNSDKKLESNVNPNKTYLQTKDISNMLYNYLKNDNIDNIIKLNPFNDRYNNNNDIFIHIRLTDAKNVNPGINYYLKAIEIIKEREKEKNNNIDKIYISSDEPNNKLITDIIDKYNNIIEIIIYNKDEIETIQFGSTCKNIILSHGTFSAIIGYLGFYSTIYYSNFKNVALWHGDIFSIDKWNEI
jgi:hypothetical protein